MAIGLALLLGFQLPAELRRPTGDCRSRTSGGAGTSRCPGGCATTCTSRSAATAAARAGRYHQPVAHHVPGRALARGGLDLRRLGSHPRRLSRRRAAREGAVGGTRRGLTRPARPGSPGSSPSTSCASAWIFFRADSLTRRRRRDRRHRRLGPTQPVVTALLVLASVGAGHRQPVRARSRRQSLQERFGRLRRGCRRSASPWRLRHRRPRPRRRPAVHLLPVLMAPSSTPLPVVTRRAPHRRARLTPRPVDRACRPPVPRRIARRIARQWREGTGAPLAPTAFSRLRRAAGPSAPSPWSRNRPAGCSRYWSLPCPGGAVNADAMVDRVDRAVVLTAILTLDLAPGAGRRRRPAPYSCSSRPMAGILADEAGFDGPTPLRPAPIAGRPRPHPAEAPRRHAAAPRMVAATRCSRPQRIGAAPDVGDTRSSTYRPLRDPLGPQPPDYYNWPAAWSTWAATEPEVVIVMFGANDGQGLIAADGTVHQRVSEPGWQPSTPAGSAADGPAPAPAASSLGAQPRCATADFDARIRIINGIYRERRPPDPGSSSSTRRPSSATSRRRLRRRLPGPSGALRDLRQGDGIHLSRAGADLLAADLVARCADRAPRLMADDATSCGSGRPLDGCCGPYLAGGQPTAEALMRSRFTAFTVGDEAHLLRTWHRDTRPRSIRTTSEQRWTPLEVLATVDGDLLDVKGAVEFGPTTSATARPDRCTSSAGSSATTSTAGPTPAPSTPASTDRSRPPPATPAARRGRARTRGGRGDRPGPRTVASSVARRSAVAPVAPAWSRLRDESPNGQRRFVDRSAQQVHPARMLLAGAGAAAAARAAPPSPPGRPARSTSPGEPNGCWRSVRVRSSVAPGARAGRGPRSTASDAGRSRPSFSSTTWRYLVDRSPCEGWTNRRNPFGFSLSTADCTVASSKLTTGSRLELWLHAQGGRLA